MASEMERSLMAKFRHLSPERQREVLGFVDALERKNRPSTPRPPLRGMLTDLGACPTADDIDKARREAWAGFPREDV